MSRPKTFLSDVGLFIVACAVYGNSLFNEFVLDDVIHIVNNTAVRSLSNALGFFFAPMFPGNLYRPVTLFSYALTYSAAGLNPFAHHLVNVLLHAAVTVVLAHVIAKFWGKKVSLFLCFVFAIHPIHTEVVANVSGRAELLAAFFGLCSLLLFLNELAAKKLTPWKLVCMSTFSLLALFSKESALCFSLLAVLFLFFKRSLQGRKAWFCLAAYTLPVFIYAALRIAALGTQSVPHINISSLDNPLVGLGFGSRLLLALTLLGTYIRLVAIPIQLSADYSTAVLPQAFSFTDVLQVLDLCLMGLFLAATIVGLRRRSVLAFSTAWFFLTFVVTANVLFLIGTGFGERLAYMPSIGALGVLLYLFRRVPFAELRWPVFAALCFSLCLKTVDQNEVWKDHKSLYSHQIRVAPQSARTQFNYGILLRNEGKISEAQNHFNQALKIFAQYEDAEFGLATVAFLRNDTALGRQHLTQALAINPRHAPSLDLFGRILLNDGNYAQAEKVFQSLAASNPHEYTADLGLFALAVSQGNLEVAQRLEARLVQAGIEDKDFERVRQTLAAKKLRQIGHRPTS